MISKKSESKEAKSAERKVGTGFWLTFRRTSQILLLSLFILLFLLSRYPIEGPFTVLQFFRIDPLIAILASLVAREWVRDLLTWSLPLLALTLVLGRFFCGWICPLGATIDIAHRYLPKRNRQPDPNRAGMWFKYAILVFVSTAALFSVGFFWLFDPLSLLLRSMTLVLYPLVTRATSSFLDTLSLIPFIEDRALDTHDWLQGFFLPVYEQHLAKSLLIALIFAGLIIAERYRSRSWCRYVCPLGALFGIFSKRSLLTRRVSEDCTNCGKCRRSCRMAAIDPDPVRTSTAECIFCMDCSEICPEGAVTFGFIPRGDTDTVVDMPRRRIIFSGLSGLVGVGLMGIGVIDRAQASTAVRPPGAVPEGEFADRCIRCYACVRACSTSGGCLQPSLAETGIEALLTPAAFMRRGYCEYNCNLCGLVCPTGAIHKLEMEDKKKRRMGLAYFDRTRCIPWESGEDCIVCEEHCPLPEKAIEFESREIWVPGKGEKTVKLPFVLRDRCIGCGICETRCPVKGRAAILVTRDGEQRWVEGV